MRYNKRYTTVTYTADDMSFRGNPGWFLTVPPAWCALTRKDMERRWITCERLDYIAQALLQRPGQYYCQPPAGVTPEFITGSNVCERVRMHAAYCVGCAMKSKPGYNTTVMAKARRVAAEEIGAGPGGSRRRRSAPAR